MKIKVLSGVMGIILCTGLINATIIYSENGTQGVADKLQRLWSGPDDTAQIMLINKLDQGQLPSLIQQSGPMIILLNGSYQERSNDIEGCLQQNEMATSTVVAEIPGDYTLFIYRGLKDAEEPDWQKKAVCILTDEGMRPDMTKEILSELRYEYGGPPVTVSDTEMTHHEAKQMWRNGNLNTVGFCLSSKLDFRKICRRINPFISCDTCWLYAEKILMECIDCPCTLTSLVCSEEDTTGDTLDVVKTNETTVVAVLPSSTEILSTHNGRNVTTTWYSGEEVMNIKRRWNRLKINRRTLPSNTSDLLKIYQLTSDSIPLELIGLRITEETRR